MEATDLPTVEELDSLGFILGKDETEDALKERYSAALGFNTHIQSEFSKEGQLSLFEFCYKPEEKIPDDVMADCQSDATEAYDISPAWVPGFYSNQNLFFLFGGMAMGFIDNDGIIAKDKHFSIFQLRDNFRHKEKFIIYGRKELISHESCHIARMALNSNIYEEVFAYRISSSGFRRHFGPIFRSSKDMAGFLIGFGAFMTSQISYVLGYEAPVLQWVGRSILILFVLGVLFRNWKTHRTFNRALDNLSTCYKDNALKVAFRLDDEEINELGQTQRDSEQTKNYLKNKLNALRNKVLDRFINA